MKLTGWTIVSPDLCPRSLCRCQTYHTAPEPAHLGNWHNSHFFILLLDTPMMISYIVAFSSSQRSWLTISQWRTLGHVDIGRSEKKINYRISGTCGNQKSETTKVQILKSEQTLRATWKLSADYTTMDSLIYWCGNPCAVESMYFWIDAAKFWSNFIAWTFVQWYGN